MTAKETFAAHINDLAGVTGLRAALHEDGGRLFAWIDEYVLPLGAALVERTDILFIADAQYPLSAMDMFWTDLDVVRPDGTVFERSESVEGYLGREWRRFSYHRNGAWNPAGNPLLDHFAFMETRWTRNALQ